MSGLIINSFRFASEFTGPSFANGASFPGGDSDFFLRLGDLTGSVNSKLWAGSMWFKRNSLGENFRMYSLGNAETRVRFTADNKLQVQGNNAGIQLRLASTTAITDTDWHHLLWAVDMADTGKRHLYVDDISDLTVETYNNVEIDFTKGEHWIGANDVATQIYDGCGADWWIANGQYINFGDVANRRKFISAGGAPVDLGSNGATPTGTAPIIFLTGGAAPGFPFNAGTGGGFTAQGSSLTECASDP